MEYLLHIAILICIYSILAQSLSLVSGFCGQISLSQAGFFGIGAYMAAIMSVDFGMPSAVILLFSLIISGIIAFVTAKVATKTVDEYFIIVTLGIQVVLNAIMKNFESLTNGALGISGIPSISFFSIEISSRFGYFLVAAIIAGLVWLLIRGITESPFGRVLLALSEDEIYTSSLGKDVSHFKIISFVIGGMIASIAGVLYAHYITYIDPTAFTTGVSIFLLSIVIVGGMKNLSGIFLSASFLVILPEALRLVGFPSSVSANLCQIVYGLALVVSIGKKGCVTVR